MAGPPGVPDFSEIFEIFVRQLRVLDFSATSQIKPIDFANLQIKPIDFANLQIKPIDFANLQIKPIDFANLQIQIPDFSKIGATQFKALELGSRFVSGMSLQAAAEANGTVTLPPNPSTSPLNREQQRFIVGYFAYVMTWLIFLYFVLAILNVDNATITAVMYLILTVTGLNGNSVAKIVKRQTERISDYLSLVGDETQMKVPISEDARLGRESDD